MSMFRCYWCDEISESVRDRAVAINDKPMCGYCWENLSCNHCGYFFAWTDCESVEVVAEGNDYVSHYHPDCYNYVLKDREDERRAEMIRDEMRDER